MGHRGLCRRLAVWTLGRERDGPQEGRGWRGREARWVRVRPQVLGKGPQCCAQPEVRMYLLWKRNGLWAALQGFLSYSKPMLGPEAPGQARKVTPDQATEKILTLGSLLAIQTVVGKGVSNCVGQIDNLGWRAQWFALWGLAVGSPKPLSCTEAEVATSSPPLGVCCHDYLSPAGPFLSKIPSPSSTSAPLTPLADGTPPCPSAETGLLLGPVSMRGTKQKLARPRAVCLSSALTTC